MTSGKYEGIATDVLETTQYSFVLNSIWKVTPSGDSQQIVRITVDPEPLPEEVTISLLAASGGAASGAGITVISSIVNGNPPTGIYFILHQLQIIILLLMIDPFIPEKMESYLEGQGFALVNLNFIPSRDLPFIDVPLDWMESEQTN